MAFGILDKILSFLHKGSRDTKKVDSVPSTEKTSLGLSKTSIANDSPPPYMDVEGMTPHNSERHVQICPHEVLSFDRQQRIANLPNFKSNGKKIDALTSASDLHHRGHDKDTKEPQDSCKPLGCDLKAFIGSLKGFGTYSWKATGPNPGLVLSFHWEMRCLEDCKVKSDSSTELVAFLEQTNIQLCPHKKLSDVDIVNRIYGIINPLGKPIDPIDRYLAKEVGNDCEHCGTKIKVYRRKEGVDKTCRVDTTRFLGKAKERGDSAWQNQCASS
ncbi:hypothetical protein N7G274_004552 [Stereocaulon virgatum]|uniref:Uncharacterized protein n=1 Tax=Stereocaulon virgatum TaxID=373712 RepID=A0ABR4AAM8_9LECA